MYILFLISVLFRFFLCDKSLHLLLQMSGGLQFTLSLIVVTYFFCSTESTLLDNKIQSDSGSTPCTCGIFLSGQFKKGSKEQPKGVPVLTQEMDTPFMNNAIGNRQCINKCLELVSCIRGGSMPWGVDRGGLFVWAWETLIKMHEEKGELRKLAGRIIYMGLQDSDS